jgi:hypothetical protein
MSTKIDLCTLHKSSSDNTSRFGVHITSKQINEVLLDVREQESLEIFNGTCQHRSHIYASNGLYTEFQEALFKTPPNVKHSRSVYID